MASIGGRAETNMAADNVARRGGGRRRLLREHLAPGALDINYLRVDITLVRRAHKGYRGAWQSTAS